MIQYENANFVWSVAEDQQLREFMKTPTSLLTVATSMQRSPLAVLLRVRKLNGFDQYTPPAEDVQAYMNNQRWTQQEDADLCRMFKDGKNIQQLMRHFDRTEKAITSRLYKVIKESGSSLDKEYQRIRRLRKISSVPKIKKIEQKDLDTFGLPHVYAMSVEDFLNTDTDIMVQELLRRLGNLNISTDEVYSWGENFASLKHLLCGSQVNRQAVISFEYRVPLTHLRIDVMMTGRDTEGNESIVIIELKQKLRIDLRNDKDPLIQAEGYSNLLKDYNSYIRGKQLEPRSIVWLPKCNELSIFDGRSGLVFGQDEEDALREQLEKYLSQADTEAEIYRQIVESEILPLPNISEMVQRMLKEQFPLIDEQQQAFNTICAAAEAKERQLVIISGDPGTGKSVVAMNALVNLTKKNKRVCYVNPDRTMPLRWMLLKEFNQARPGTFKPLFLDLGEVYKRDNFDVIILDEAHKLNYGKDDSCELAQLMNMTQVLVLMSDVHQTNRVYDVFDEGYYEDLIQKECPDVNIQPKIYLRSQFRCNGTENYTRWLQSMLFDSNCTERLDINEYPFIIMDKPGEVTAAIQEKVNTGQRARLLIGDSWLTDWDGNSHFESDFPLPTVTEKMANIWANDNRYAQEFGKSHQCVGLEFDYVGVFIMNDLIYENGRTSSAPNRNDQLYRVYRETIWSTLTYNWVKNTYYALLTRGIKGCYVYIHDPELREYFRSHLKQ